MRRHSLAVMRWAVCRCRGAARIVRSWSGSRTLAASTDVTGDAALSGRLDIRGPAHDRGRGVGLVGQLAEYVGAVLGRSAPLASACAFAFGFQLGEYGLVLGA
jgi:hypothetical protein